MLIRAFSLAAVAQAATYVLDASFPNLTNVPKNILANFSNVRCVAFDGADLHAVHLGSPPILTFGIDGAYKRAWGAGALVFPHGCVHHAGELWVADAINNPHLGEARLGRDDEVRGAKRVERVHGLARAHVDVDTKARVFVLQDASRSASISEIVTSPA